MTFGAVFQRPFAPVFDRGLGAAAGWWVVAGKTCVAAYQPIGAASLAASYVNLANPGTYNAAPGGGAPTWASGTGWQAGSGVYLTTGIVPQSTWTVICRFAGMISNSVMFGSFWGGAYYQYERYNNVFYYENGPFVAATAPAGNAGVIAIADRACYLNGTLDKTLAAGAPSALPIYLLNRNPIAGVATAGSMQAIAIYSDTLSAGEVATVSSAMAAL